TRQCHDTKLGSDLKMDKSVRLEIVSRRDFVLGASAVAALSALIPSLAHAQDKPAAAVPTGEDMLKSILKDAKAAEGKVMLDLPEIAENGNTVPFTVSVESPMTDKDHVKAVHIVSMGNPRPE